MEYLIMGIGLAVILIVIYFVFIKKKESNIPPSTGTGSSE